MTYTVVNPKEIVGVVQTLPPQYQLINIALYVIIAIVLYRLVIKKMLTQSRK